MERVLLVVCSFAIALAAPPALVHNGDRIVGGTEAEKLEFPWQVSLRYAGSPNCGGSIISEEWILTAAHCVVRVPPNYTLVVGEHNLIENDTTEELFHPAKLIPRPDFSLEDLDYDIALIKLPQPLDFNGKHKHLRPIALPASDANFDEQTCISTGWGSMSTGGKDPNVLHKVDLRVYPHQKCVDAYSFFKPVSERMLCAGYEEGGKSPCHGDSGGPLQCKQPDGSYVVAGVVSWIFICGFPTLPGVYARVSAFRSWIDETIAAN